MDALAIQIDIDLVGAPILGTLAPLGGGVSGGIVVDFNIPSLEDVGRAILENPLNPIGEIVSQSVNDVGLIGSYRGSAGFDLSAGISADYTPGSATDFSGTSTQVEGGVGLVSVTGASFDNGTGTGIPSSNGAVGIELSLSPLPASGSISREKTGVLMLSELTDKD